MIERPTPPASGRLLKKPFSNKAVGLAVAAALGLLGFALALQLAGLSSSAEGDKSTIAEGRITFHTGDWYGQSAVFYELTGEHSVVAFGKLHSPKKHTCEWIEHVRYFDLYKAPTLPEPIYDENGTFTGKHKELEPARQSGSYKSTWSGHFCMMVVWGDYRESIGYGSFYGPFTTKKGLIEQDLGPVSPTPEPAPPPKFSITVGQRISPDGTRIRVMTERGGSGSVAIASWNYLVADPAGVTINDGEDCRAVFGGSSASGVLVSERAMIKEDAGSAYADVAPQHAGAWICFKAVDRDDNTVYSFAQLIQHPDSEADRRDNQNGSPDNNGGNGSQPDTNAHGTEAAQPAEAPSGGSADQDAAPGGDQPEAVSAAEQGIDPEGSPAGEDQSTADGAEEPATAASATGASLSEGSESGLPGWLVIVAGLAATAAVVLISVTVLSMRKK